MSDKITLKDGYQLPKSTFENLWSKIKEVKKESDYAFFDLVEKCKNVQHKFIKGILIDDPKQILQQYGLLEEDELVPLIVQKIVLNAIQGTGLWTELVSPLQKKQVSFVKDLDCKKDTK